MLENSEFVPDFWEFFEKVAEVMVAVTGQLI